MHYSIKNGLLWLGIYFILGLLPMAIAVAGELPEFRTFWIEFGVALGFVGLAMFALQFVFSGRLEKVAPVFGQDNILNFHRELGITAFFLILAHPIILILAEPDFISYFDPTDNFFRAIALSFVVVFIILITATSLWRVNFKLEYEKWRLWHGFFSLAIVFIGLTHSLQVSHYLEPLWKKIALSVVMCAAMYLVVHTRVVRPWLNKKRPFKITKIKQELGNAWTLTIEPEKNIYFEFKPGQFAWITIGPTPFSIQQHPFSFASSARARAIAFTAIVEGGFTATWKHTPLETRVWLEGPFGSFTPKQDSNLFLVMGGIGVTPAMSMLRTMKDDQDPRQAILVYANKNVEEITFRKELNELRDYINLKVVHVLEDPPYGWEGEEGFVTKEILDKQLPDKPGEYTYYVCGPDPMMDMVGMALYDLNIPWNRIYMERFQIV